MTGPHPAVAAVRAAVRACVGDLGADAPVVVALSGGPDSLALLAGTVFERPATTVAVVIDHGWHPASAEVSARAAEAARAIGAATAQVVAVGPLAPGEEPARQARYEALSRCAAALGATAVLLGHTRDDQAETVLLGLARGSGARSLAGMAERRGLWRRPLLGLPHATTLAACRALGLAVWTDPANVDPRHARVRARARVLPVLEAELGPGTAAGLARSARLLRDDADALDAAAGQALGAVVDAAGSLDCAALAQLAPAVRRRVLMAATPARTADHAAALERLVTHWHGQGPVSLPDGVRAGRARGRIWLVPPPDVVAPPAAAGRELGLPAPPAGPSAPAGPAPQPARGQLPPPQSAPSPDEGIAAVLIPEAEIRRRIGELAAEIDRDYAGRDVLLVGVLKGAIMVMADLSRALQAQTSLEFMAVSSYGAATTTSGVVRILKDLDRDISGRHVIVVEDVIDSGLTLSWLLRNLRSRGPASLEVCALLRKPEAVALGLPVRYVGFDIGAHFVVGYGLDVAERYRNLPYIGLLSPDSPLAGRAGTG